MVEKLFADLGPRFKARAGGYTRILRMVPRAGDNAPMALMQLVDKAGAVVAAEKPAAAKPARKKKKAAAPAAEAAPGRRGQAAPPQKGCRLAALRKLNCLSEDPAVKRGFCFFGSPDNRAMPSIPLIIAADSLYGNKESL